MALMGFLVLEGVVVNNGIVFVDYVNKLRLNGWEKKEALIETGKTRMRPIMMTALTTILAMSTLAFSKDSTAGMSRGMGDRNDRRLAVCNFDDIVYRSGIL